jgi:uncharacterized protein (TIGR02594 family)
MLARLKAVAVIGLLLPIMVTTAQARPTKSHIQNAHIQRMAASPSLRKARVAANHRRYLHHRRVHVRGANQKHVQAAKTVATCATSHLACLLGFASVSNQPSSSTLASAARRYMGTNPTGWNRVWCGRFMEMVVKETGGHVPRGPALARNWANLPHVSAQVGAIAVLARGRGGHVGIVTGFDHKGNPIIVSGNHGHVVGEGVYPRGRVLAYVAAS